MGGFKIKVRKSKVFNELMEMHKKDKFCFFHLTNKSGTQG